MSKTSDLISTFSSIINDRKLQIYAENHRLYKEKIFVESMEEENE